MKLNFKQKLFFYFSLVFAFFTISVIVFQQINDKKQKKEVLVEKLDIYSDFIHSFIQKNKSQLDISVESSLATLPDDIRLSILNKQGEILYDNSIEDVSKLENHSNRHEIINAKNTGSGFDVRESKSIGDPYLYYAKSYHDYFVRVALPYDIKTKKVLEADNYFIYFIILFFTITLFLINTITNNFGKSIKQLRDFAFSVDKETISSLNFPHDELGEIGIKITENYNKLKESQKELILEREKLLQHIHSSEEGICFFSENNEVIFFNGLFVQYLNTITEDSSNDPSIIFTDKNFKKINKFLESKENNYLEYKISKQGKNFSIRVVILQNNSFEIIINDITTQEKTRLLKQEMTSNIAHELRTPLTSIRGYLETVIEQDLDELKRNYFLKQAHHQTVVLSDIVKEMSLITKMDEAPQTFPLEEVNLHQLLKTLKRDLSISLEENESKLHWKIPKNLNINANKNLVYSIFRNLTENSIRYAGKGKSIEIHLINEDKEFYYFNFFDNGPGISDEKHFNRIFERFYRINEGRTRDTGGTGLGLSIVKNAVNFHKGKITVKNRKEGGLEFLFSLKK